MSDEELKNTPSIEEDSVVTAEDEEAESTKSTEDKPLEDVAYELEEDELPEIKDEIEQDESAWNRLDVKTKDYSDARVVRKMWVNQRTDLLKKYRPGLRFDLSEPLIPSRMTKASFLRERNVELIKVKKRNLQAEMERMSEVGREVPKYKDHWPKENLTSQFRFKLSRNNPVVCSHYIEHYEQYKRPPFVAGFLPKCRK